MPRVVVFLAICVAIALVGIEIKQVYAHLKPLPWNEWLPVMDGVRQLSIARMKSRRSCLFLRVL